MGKVPKLNRSKRHDLNNNKISVYEHKSGGQKEHSDRILYDKDKTI